MNPETEITLTLTAQDINLIGQLFDLAVKAGGLDAAQVAVPLVNKLRDAAIPKEPSE